MERSRMKRWASTGLLVLLACGFIAQNMQIRNLQAEKEQLLEQIVEKILLDYELEQILEDLAPTKAAEGASSLQLSGRSHVGQPSEESEDKVTTPQSREHRTCKRGGHVEARERGKP